MAFAYKRKGSGFWWIRATDPATKKLISEPTKLRVLGADGQPDAAAKRRAREQAKKVQRRLDDAARTGGGTAPTGDPTVREYAKLWIPKRRDLDLDWKNDSGRLEHHILPVIGDMRMADVRGKQIAALVHRWRTTPLVTTGEVMAPRTVRNAYSVLTAMFRDAVLDGTVEQTPCILNERELGPVVDKDPKWRRGAVFTREEAEVLISHDDIPVDRRLFYALELLAGMRPGEIAALRVADYDSKVEPLGRITVALALNTRKLTIKGTKTGAVREVPVHPTLAAMLGEWLLSGFAAQHGRAPTAEDLLLPLPPKDAARRRTRKGEPIRTGDYAGKKWREVDQPMLGWRERQMYDGKSTFITLCGKDKANRDAIKRITHAPTKRDAFDGYDRDSHWDEMCEAVSKLRVTRRRVGGKLVAIK